MLGTNHITRPRPALDRNPVSKTPCVWTIPQKIESKKKTKKKKKHNNNVSI
jgi:hypothetical protein